LRRHAVVFRHKQSGRGAAQVESLS